MPDMGAVAAALTSFKTLKDIAQTMVALRDTKAFQTKLIEFNGALIDAQTHIFSVNEERAALVDRVHALETMVVQLEAWEAEKQRYELKEVAPRVYAYVVKPSMQGSEPLHWMSRSIGYVQTATRNIKYRYSKECNRLRSVGSIDARPRPAVWR